MSERNIRIALDRASFLRGIRRHHVRVLEDLRDGVLCEFEGIYSIVPEQEAFADKPDSTLRHIVQPGDRPDLAGRVLVPTFPISSGGPTWTDLSGSDADISVKIRSLLLSWADKYFLHTLPSVPPWIMEAACATLSAWQMNREFAAELDWHGVGYKFATALREARENPFALHLEDVWFYEPWHHFEKRVSAFVKAELDRYRTVHSKYYERIGYDTDVDWDARSTDHLEWLALFQTHKWSAKKIKGYLHVSQSEPAILMGLKVAATRIGLQIRPSLRELKRSRKP